MIDADPLRAAAVDFGNLIGQIQQHVVRSGAHAGAEVFYDEMKRRVPVRYEKLRDAIYQKHVDEEKTHGKATYRISVNHHKQPNWHLLEFGHWQYFVVVKKPDGSYVTAVRPEMRGQPRPRARASIAEKSRYYIPLPGGPRFIAARPFLRPAADKAPAAMAAMKVRFHDKVGEVFEQMGDKTYGKR